MYAGTQLVPDLFVNFVRGYTSVVKSWQFHCALLRSDEPPHSMSLFWIQVSTLTIHNLD